MSKFKDLDRVHNEQPQPLAALNQGDFDSEIPAHDAYLDRSLYTEFKHKATSAHALKQRSPFFAKPSASSKTSDVLVGSELAFNTNSAPALSRHTDITLIAKSHTIYRNEDQVYDSQVVDAISDDGSSTNRLVSKVAQAKTFIRERTGTCDDALAALSSMSASLDLAFAPASMALNGMAMVATPVVESEPKSKLKEKTFARGLRWIKSKKDLIKHVRRYKAKAKFDANAAFTAQSQERTARALADPTATLGAYMGYAAFTAKESIELPIEHTRSATAIDSQQQQIRAHERAQAYREALASSGEDHLEPARSINAQETRPMSDDSKVLPSDAKVDLSLAAQVLSDKVSHEAPSPLLHALSGRNELNSLPSTTEAGANALEQIIDPSYASLMSRLDENGRKSLDCCEGVPTNEHAFCDGVHNSTPSYGDYQVMPNYDLPSVKSHSERNVRLERRLNSYFYFYRDELLADHLKHADDQHRVAAILAYGIFRQWMHRRRMNVLQPDHVYGESLESIFYYTAMLLIQTMVFAIRSDGRIDSQEHASLVEFCSAVFNQQIKNVRGEIDRMLTIDVDPSSLAAMVKFPEESLDMYLLSAVMLKGNHILEQGYLENLAACLGIDPSLKHKLDLRAQELSCENPSQLSLRKLYPA